MLTNAPKGTKDTTPDKVYRWHYIEKKFADICKRYGFEIGGVFGGQKQYPWVIGSGKPGAHNANVTIVAKLL